MHCFSCPPRRRRGITLVEVLMVVAVLTVLLAMLLPAVQHFRNSARRIDCGNNLKHLATAIQAFENQHGVLPPNWGSYPHRASKANWAGKSSAETPMFGSWIAHILPYIDMNTDYMRLPRAKLCLGYRRYADEPGVRGPEGIIPYAEGMRRTEEDGIFFNVHSGPRATVTGNTGETFSGTRVTVTNTPSSTMTLPIYQYTKAPSTVFSMNGVKYTIWRTTQTITGSRTVVTPASSSTTVVVGNARDNLTWNTEAGTKFFNANAWGVLPYFNLSKYPAAQETIRVPLVVCKGDNSVIESSRKLPWLQGRGWSTTNYMTNPFAFSSVSGTEAVVNVNQPAWSPAGWGRYKIAAGQKRLGAIPDGTTSTILLAEAMRYCTSIIDIQGESAGTVPTAIEIARLAFWSSPSLVTHYDMYLDRYGDHTDSQFLGLAIQPHPLATSGTTEMKVGQLYWKVNPVSNDVSWKPWTHNFGVEWESSGAVGELYANTFFFQAQPRPQECSAFRAQSNHGNLLMVAMCDGSVKPIRSTISRREVTDADTVGKQLAGAPNMGNQGTPDGVWDKLMRDNDGTPVEDF